MRRRRGLLLAMWVFHALLIIISGRSCVRVRAQDDAGGSAGGGAATDPSGGGDGIIVTEANLAALLAIKHSFSDPQGALSSWNESGVGACSGSWSGIKCARGQVIAIQLPLKGLAGMISERVGELTELRKLNLHTNKIGGPIPASLAALRSLRGVYLFQNKLSGSIPVGLGSSPVMQAIDLSSNGLQGDLPASLGSSPRLLLLNLANNNLSGGVPPEWGASASLVTLILSGNAISGALPDTWGKSSTSSTSSTSSDSSSPPRLRHMDLSENRLVGGIPSSLANMVELDELHLQGNELEGSIPSRELSSLKLLRVFDLSRNRINGSIPGSIGALSALSSIDLSHNHLSGPMPTSLGQLSNLTELNLSDNRLNGSIPGSLARLQNLTSFNVSNNRLSGRVPAFVHPFSASAFAGNLGLCGFNSSSGAIISCSAPPPPAKAPQQQQQQRNNNNNSRKNRLSKVSLICIILGGALALGAAVCMLMLVAWRFREQRAAAGRERSNKGKAEAAAAGGAAGGGAEGGGNGNGKLVHFDGPFSFTADDLLCATAEVMGKSTYGTVYKASMENGNTVVVKRLREGIVRSQREFEVEVSALGRIRHPNLVALRAYYWGPKDEKLLVYDFMNGGSLAAYLHARGPETPLGWSTRMKIALGAARGLGYLHDTEKMVHGNLTSSNILLDAHLNAVISDYGLSRLMTSSAGSTVLATTGSQGYRAPEVTKLKKATTKSDVYSFGIVLLELLTGKAPGDAVSTADGGALDLPEWVSSVVKEEWTSEVFDVELLKGAAPSEDDMLNTLQLAMNCVSASSSSRPDMAEVLRQVEAVAAADHHKSAASSGTASREG